MTETEKPKQMIARLDVENRLLKREVSELRAVVQIINDWTPSLLVKAVWTAAVRAEKRGELLFNATGHLPEMDRGDPDQRLDTIS